MGGGAWPFVVGGAICLVNSDNERDSVLLNRRNFDISKARRLALRRSFFRVGAAFILAVRGFYCRRIINSS